MAVIKTLLDFVSSFLIANICLANILWNIVEKVKDSPCLYSAN